MLRVRATVDPSLFEAVEAVAGRGRPDRADPIAALGRLVAERAEFGAEGHGIAADPARAFAVERFADPGFWRHQRALLQAMLAGVDETVAAVEAFLPDVPDERVATVTVLPVPGLTTCYGAGDGRQIFGLYDGASPEEMLLFCSHTYLHEISSLVNTEASRAAERDPSTARALRHLVMLLIRNEGIANLAVLDEVRRLRDAAGGTGLRYFDYAPLIDDETARVKALTACRELLARVDDANAGPLLPKVTAAFKNPKLPVINLVGIHLAEAVAAAYGLARVTDVDGRDPQEFFQAYADSPDRLREHLFGPGFGAAGVFGVRPPAAAGRPGATTRGEPPAVIDLSLGDPGYGPPPEVIEAMSRALAAGPVGYAPRGGFPALRRAVADKLAARNGIDADPGDVVVTTGASHALFAVALAACRPGDRVLVPVPGFPLYRLAASSLDLRVVGYPLDEATGEPDWEVFERACSDARLLVWNYPSNPLGVVGRPEWTERLLALLAARPRLVVVSDEVYEDLCFDGGHVTTAALAPDEIRDRVVSIYSFSKSHGMTGWRIGYAHAPGGLAAEIARRHWAVSMSTPTVAQVGALAALRLGTAPVAERLSWLRSQRDVALKRLHDMGLACPTPSAGLFCWLDVGETGLDAQAFVQAAARQARVLLSAGDEFGVAGSRRVRLSYAAAEPQLDAGLDRLAAWLARGRPDADRPAAGEVPDRRASG